MAFISEEISTEEDKKYFMTIGFTNMVNKPLKPDWWAIDRDRNIILTSRGGVIGEPWFGYQLYMDNEFINIEAIDHSEGNSFENTAIIRWIILKMEIPTTLLDKGYDIDEVKKVVNDAFISWGCPGLKPSQIIEVTVEFKTEPRCI